MSKILKSIYCCLTATEPQAAQQFETLSWLLAQGTSATGAAANVFPDHHTLATRLAGGDSWGQTLTEAQLVNPLEAQLLEAFNSLGRLPEGLKAVAEGRSIQHRTIRIILLKSAYPLVVIHLAIVVMHIQVLLKSGLGTALLSLCLSLVCLETILLGLSYYLVRSWRSGHLENMPLLGKWYLNQERYKALFLLEKCHSCGVLWDQALENAASTINAPSLKMGLTAACQHLSQSGNPGEIISSALSLPSFCRTFLVSGEMAGGLERSLKNCREALGKIVANQSRTIAMIAYATIYFLAVALAVYVVISFYLRIYSFPGL